MPRFSPLLATAASLLALPCASHATAAPPEVVELPTVSVHEKMPASSGAVTVITTEPGPSSAEAFTDLARQTAGWSVNDAGERGFGQTTTLRGLGNTPFFSDASAPVYLDDIPLASGFTFPTELYDFAQMSIYRGPQAAALFGRAGDAGVIQLTSAAAGAQSTARLGATAGSYGLLSFTASAQTARSETFDASLNLGSSQRSGYIENTQLGRNVDDRHSIFGRMRLHYRPAEDLELSLHVLGQRSRDGAQALVPLGGPFYAVKRGKEGEADTDFTAVALSINKRLTDATLTATTSYSDWDLSPYNNRLVVFGGFNLDSGLTQSQRTLNEEIRFASELLTGGAFFSHSRTLGAADRRFSGFPFENSRFDLGSDSYALFGQASLKPSPDWLITPGLRLEQSHKDFTRTEVVPSSIVLHRNDTWNALLPSLGVTKHIDASTDLVFTVSRGFKPGGYSAYTDRPDLAGYDPQRTWGVEAAVSTSDQNTGWAFTSRTYAYYVRGYQIERSFAVPAATKNEYLVVNADRAQVLGLEVESSWRPVRDLTISAVAGLTHVTLEDFTDPFTGANYSGKRAPYAPGGNAALRVDYRPARGFFGGASVTWTGKTYYDEQETAMLSQNAYTLLNADAGYAFARGSVRIFGRNLGDKAYYSSITPGVGHGTPGAPLTWGAEVSCRW
jgi:outer membrane receptor protein involved in Fe transport